MKRAKQTSYGMRYSDLSQAFTKDQFAWIGAVAMQYNETEAQLKEIVAEFIEFSGNPHEVISRINGIEGIVGIIDAALSTRHYSAVKECFDGAIKGNDGFAILKTIRDATIHSRLRDQATGVADHFASKGRMHEVLLTNDALKRLCEALGLVEKEFLCITRAIRLLKRIDENSASHGLPLEKHAELLQEAIAQCRSYQQQRLSLPPYPKFPKERPQTRLPPLRTGIRQKKPE